MEIRSLKDPISRELINANLPTIMPFFLGFSPLLLDTYSSAENSVV